MKKTKLKQVIIDQQELFKKKEDIINREINLDYYLKGNEIVIVSGIRRCGKSTLLKLISEKLEGIKIYINFDDIRLIDFNSENFDNINEIVLELFDIKENEKIYYFLDEIQNIKYWERWVNNLYSQGIKVFVTGSNSSLLSSEISTYLTGRNKLINLFPFNFKEYLIYKKIKIKNLNLLTTKEKIQYLKHFREYLNLGGFPVVIKNNDIELSGQYFEDILIKDIIVRYKIKEIKELKDMVLFLFSNIGKAYSYSTLKSISSIKSLSTIKNYIDYMENSFLLSQLNRFDYSIKKQKVSSSKIYSNDNSFLKTVAFNISQNYGRKLENLVFIELKRRSCDAYYHFDKKECDFVIKENNKITSAIQVTQSLEDKKTRKREIEGLLDATKKYKLKEGLILTEDEEEEFIENNVKIIVKPIWKWCLSKS